MLLAVEVDGEEGPFADMALPFDLSCDDGFPLLSEDGLTVTDFPSPILLLFAGLWASSSSLSSESCRVMGGRALLRGILDLGVTNG